MAIGTGTAIALSALVGAAGSAYSANRAKSAAERGSQSTGHTRLVPSDNTAGHIDRWLSNLQDIFTQRQDAGPQYFPGQIPGGGPSGLTNDLIRQLAEAEFLNTGFGGTIRDYMQGQLGNPTGLTQDAYNAISGYRPAYHDAAIQLLFSGDPIINEYISSRMSGGGFAGGGGAGAGGALDPGSIPGLGEPTNEYDRSVLAGDFLDLEANPFLQEIADTIRRESMESFENVDVPSLTSDFIGARRYGSNAFGQMQTNALEETMEAIAGSLAGLYGQNYQLERGLQDSAAGRLSALDQALIGSATSRANAGTAANAAIAQARERALLDAFGLRTQGLGLGANLISDLQSGDLSRLGMMLNAAQNDQAFQLGLLGEANANLGLEGSALAQALSGSSAADAQRAAGSWRRYQQAMDRWNYERDFPVTNSLQMLDVLKDFGATFGTHETHNTQAIPYTGQSAWQAGLLGGMGGALMGPSLKNAFSGGKNKSTSNVPDYEVGPDYFGTPNQSNVNWWDLMSTYGQR